MSTKRSTLSVLIAFLIFASLACSLPSLNRSTPEPEIPAETEESPEAETPASTNPAGTVLTSTAATVQARTTQQPSQKTAPPQPATPLPGSGTLNPAPPEKPVRLIFIHHSTGEGWLSDDGGGLAIALRDNRYFVSDTNYDWGPTDSALDGPIGSFTDFGHWWNWFNGPNHEKHMAALYSESKQTFDYSRLPANPGGANEIILFKSCFPNSALAGKPTDPPTTGNNPLRGQDAGSDAHTVANAKGIYLDLLSYFAQHQDKLFIIITQPPLTRASTDNAQAANARAFATWLTQDWLRNYPHKNVAVFDFFTVLTTNGGRTTTNDLNSDKGNHHRFRNGKIEHIIDQGSNFSAYGSSNDDSHPTPAGGKKATGEFVPLLNIYYHRWKGN